VLLLFAGSQLSMTIMDIKHRNDIFIVIWIFGVSLAINLAIGFITGLIFAYVINIILRRENGKTN
jgi:SulP family sulfate permease